MNQNKRQKTLLNLLVIACLLSSSRIIAKEFTKTYVGFDTSTIRPLTKIESPGLTCGPLSANLFFTLTELIGNSKESQSQFYSRYMRTCDPSLSQKIQKEGYAPASLFNSMIRQFPELREKIAINFFEKKDKESDSDLLKRFHQYAVNSLNKNLPIIISIFGVGVDFNITESKYEWGTQSIISHFLLITKVQKNFNSSDHFIEVEVYDSDATTDPFYHVNIITDEFRNFGAYRYSPNIEGPIQWDSSTPRPFLEVTSPRLNMNKSNINWWGRHLIYLQSVIGAR